MDGRNFYGDRDTRARETFVEKDSFIDRAIEAAAREYCHWWNLEVVASSPSWFEGNLIL